MEWATVENEMKKRDMKIADLARTTGIPYSTFTDWKAGRYTPKHDKLVRIAACFNIPVDDDGVIQPDYYIDAEAKELAQFLFKNPDYRVLFDAARNVKKEDLMFVKEFIDRFSK